MLSEGKKVRKLLGNRRKNIEQRIENGENTESILISRGLFGGIDFKDTLCYNRRRFKKARIRTMEKKKIVVEELPGGFRAYLDGHYGIFGTGNCAIVAVGDLVCSHPELFEVEIHDYYRLRER